MTLMTLVRGLIALLVCYMVTALGLGVLGTRGLNSRSTDYYLPRPAFSDTVPVGGRRAAEGEQMLVDTRTGEHEPIRLPDNEGWGLLSVSPWRDREGKLLAVGRWVRSHREHTDLPLWGLGVLRLPEATVVQRSPLDLLPTGRPCWLPNRPGAIVFPAADGRLYRADLELDAAALDGGLASENSRPTGGRARVRPVSWTRTLAGDQPVLLYDPVVSSDPRLRKLVFAAICLPGAPKERRVFEPARLWWLELDDEGVEIVAAGPLQNLRGEPLEGPETTERYPNVAIQGERIRLVYLARRPGQATGSLKEREIEIDPKTNRPRVKPETFAVSSAGDSLSLGPLLVSADGGSVFAVDRLGRNARLRIHGR